VIEDTIADPARPREIDRIYFAAGAAVIMGVVLRPALFTLPASSPGRCRPHAPSLVGVAITAVKAFGRMP